MPDSPAIEAEPPVQPKFSLAGIAGALVLAALILFANHRFERMPHWPAVRPVASGTIHLQPIALDANGLAPLRLVSAWSLTASSMLLAGVSGLAIDGDELVALTDTGVVARLPARLEPQMRGRVFGLPSGPGDPRVKANRDSEAIVRDPNGRGWWTAFEHRHELWLYDLRFERALQRIAIPRGALSYNSGIEGLAADGDALLAFPELGGVALRFDGRGWRSIPVDRRARVSDAVGLGGGQFLVVERRLTLTGFDNALALMERRGGSLGTVWRRRLPGSWRDNIEGIAAARSDGGGYRLWLVSDNNFHPRLRTVVMVIDVPAAALPKRP